MSSSRPSHGGPNHRDLYLIVIGVVAGIGLGPYVLGRVSSETYDRLFVVGATGLEELRQLDAQKLDQQSRFPQGATAVAITEWLQNEAMRQQNRRRDLLTDHLARLRGMMAALVLAMVAIMALETFAASAAPAALASRLAATRYALVAVWIAIVLAQPRLLHVASGTFVLLLVVVAVVAAFLPVKSRESGVESPDSRVQTPDS